MPLPRKAVLDSKPKRPHLTEHLVQHARPEATQYTLRDRGQNARRGLHVIVFPSGVRTFYFQRKKGEPAYRIGPAGPYTLEKARIAADALFVQLEAGVDPRKPVPDPAASPVTLRQFIDNDYRPHFSAHHGNDKNLANLRAFESFAGRPLSAITVKAIQAWRTQRLRDGAAPATINRNLAALKACLRFAVDQGVIEQHPLAGKLPRLTVAQENRVRYLSADEQKRLLDALAARETRIRDERASGNVWRAARHQAPLPDLSNYKFADHLLPMVLISMNTGLRQGELFSLEWNDVIEGRTITVQSGKAKSKRTRHIPLNKEARETLQAWRDQTGDTGYVFQSEGGRRFDNVKKAWAKILVDALVSDFVWHDLRHHFASRLAMAGAPLNTIRELMGHSDLAMTIRYSHLSPGHTRDAVELLMPV